MVAGYCAIQNCRHLGASRRWKTTPRTSPTASSSCRSPQGGKYVTVGGGWAFVANAKGKNPEAAGKFIAWALASMKPDSIQRGVDWCTVAKSRHADPHQRARRPGADAFNKGNLGVFAKDILPGTRAEPRLPPQVYKIISDAIQQTQLGGADPQATATAASKQLDAFLATYNGAPMM